MGKVDVVKGMVKGRSEGLGDKFGRQVREVGKLD